MGFNLANSTTCLPHRLQYPLSILTGSSHGAGLMALFRSWIENTYEFSPLKFDRIGEWLADEPVNGKGKFLQVYDHFGHCCGKMMRLRELGVKESDIGELVKNVFGNLANDPAGNVSGIVRKIYEDAL